ncbi:sarcolemma associated protein a isoform X3 [Anguilla anguilla]|uniref:sarcolemma associated protein a isoform X3 n=1 Tax=Anguilla anguilla TaxID=7936 RepID=UPI0015B2D1FD|nr:sarcolemma associated protein a isoform X3 [Anguilla anguilla]
MPSALAVFTCRPNSHPFQERHVYLDEPVKIGRSVARCRPAQNNATFDCKVLSRNHALVWFDHKTGKFYLQDTKSSNGTFINSQRLSRGSEESPPCEVLSGDIIQFGVDVTENTRKVTHGCIVSTIKLFLPDGMEARRRSDVIQAPLPLPVDKVAANTPSMYSQELFQLSQYLQEALHREQMLEQKLATLQRLLASTQEASESSWQALIDEDRLLSRLEVMGNQLQAFSKNQTEDGIRKELVALQEDKHNYETTAKESLRRVLQEKIEVVRKLSEVERSLSNTEDECTHLKEMNERTREELRELANKYNGAVNEIKDLTDKIKLAEGRQEEISQKGQSEKKELQMRIEEMEEKEQALQARIEALQADNDFTNERLTALQVRLEQLQEKNVKENNSLEHFLLNSGEDCTFIQQFIECQPVKQLKEAVDSSLTKIPNFDEVIDAHLQNNQMSEENSLDSPERLKAKLIDDVHHQNVMDENKLVKENQIDAKESDMSDTLSPSKDKSSDDTSDGQMDEQELNEPLNKVATLKDELRRADLEPGDTDHMIQHLRTELLEAQELANTGKQKCLELQALLEEERRTNKQQTEDSAKQIQFLQAQLQKLHVDMEELREQRESSISSTREELYSAQEEVLMLRHVMETATAERERDIAALKADLDAVTAELEKWRQAAAKYELEISTLQASFQQHSQHREKAAQLQDELDRLQKDCSSLQRECTALRSEKVALLEKLQKLEVELDSSREQSAFLSSSLNALEKSQGALETKLGSMQDQHMQDAGKLQTQLAQADSRTKSLQKEYEETQSLLSDLRERYERTEQEKRSINDELEQCKLDLKLLQEKGGNPSILQPTQAIFIGVILALLYWCFGQLW